MDTASKSRPRWAGHTRIGNVWEYPRPSRDFSAQSLTQFYLRLAPKPNRDRVSGT